MLDALEAPVASGSSVPVKGGSRACSLPPGVRLRPARPGGTDGEWRPDRARVYHFGAFTVDARTGELSHDDRRTPLRDQSLQLLLALLEHPGELITREELAGRLLGG